MNSNKANAAKLMKKRNEFENKRREKREKKQMLWIGMKKMP